MSTITHSGRRLSVSTWSLHRTLGDPPGYGPGDPQPAWPDWENAVALLDLPERLADFGIHTLELCHFHLPSRDDGYLKELRRALDAAGIELWAFLIDSGNVVDPVNGERDRQWIADWLPVASALGAKTARVVAGKAEPTPERLARSRRALAGLAQVAADLDVRLTTENWHALLSTPDAVDELLDGLTDQIGFCIDLGNWSGPTKYADLARIAPYADGCHAKCRFDADGPDRADYARSLALLDAAGFDGPYTLIYDGPSADEWAGLAVEREMVAPYLGSVRTNGAPR
jgi:sugar phosphate isomerase/epimerase